jgi:large subunit ribosomal protein L3
VFKNKKMPGQLGNERVTMQRLQVVRVDAADNLLLIKGAIPGAKNGIVLVKDSVKSR